MKSRLMWLVLGIGLTAAVMGSVWAATSGEVEVRVNARHLEDGRVEVAVQQHDGDSWGDRQRPDSRFVPAGAQANHWYSSSAVSIEVPVPEDELFCLVTHAQPGDDGFWTYKFEAMAHRWDVYHDGITVQVKHGATPQIQAEMLQQCLDDGATAVGSSLADPEPLRDVLLSAVDAGITVVTFNSGLQDYKSVGSSRHVSVNEPETGRQVGALLVERGVTGNVACVIHEARNVGLDERCDGLEEGYTNGSIERFHVAGVGDIEATKDDLKGQLLGEDGEPLFGGVVTLNSDIGSAALAVVRETGADIKIATFDENREVLEAIREGEILFSVDTVPQYQAFYALSSMLQLARTIPRILELYKVDDPHALLSQLPVLLGPRLYTSDNAREWLQTVYGTDRSVITTEVDDN
ncbi:MAG: substrate-binding domain-containing protein [Chloroflexota bacterium]|nr:substrate-binding domain-containing protein [Chloroflexota bacterium]